MPRTPAASPTPSAPPDNERRGEATAVEAPAGPRLGRIEEPDAYRLLHFSLDRLQDAAFWIAESGELLYVNEAACQSLDLDREKLLTKTIFDISPHDASLRWEGVWQQAKERGSLQFEATHRARDGRMFPVAVMAHFLEVEGRQYLLGLARDITDKKLVSEALRHTTEVTRILTDSMNEGMIQADSQGVVQFVNERFCEIVGYRQEEVLGQPADRFFLRSPVPDQTLAEDPSWRESDLYDLPVKAASGETVWLQVSKSPMVDPMGNVMGVLGITRDITAQRRAEEKLQENQERLRLMLEQLPAVLWTTDGELCFASNAGAGLASLELQPNQLVGQDLGSFVERLSPGSPLLAMHRRALAGESVSFEDTWRGHVYEIYLEPLRDGGGTVVGTIGFALDVTERKKTLAALNLQEAYFRQLFESSPQAIAILDETDRVLDVNGGFETLFGFSRQEAKGRYINDIIVPGEFETEAEGLSARVLSGNHIEQETIRQHKDRRHIDISVISYPIRLEGRVVGVFAIYSDMTERRRAERALRDSEEKFKKLFYQASDPMLICDPEGHVVDGNQRAVDMIGYSPEEFQKLTVDKIHPPDVGAMILEALPNVSRDEVASAEVPVQTKSGEIFYADLQLSALEIGGRTLVHGVARDVTERRRAEDELRLSEEKFSNLFHQSNDGIIIHDLAAGINEVNRKALEQFGYSREEFLALTLPDLYAERDLGKAAEAVERVATEGFVNFEILCRKKDGALFPAEISSSVFEVAGRKVIQEIVRDVTERKQAEEQLRESEERYALAVRGASDGLWDWDLKIDQVYFSPRWKAMLGLAENEVENSPEEWWKRVHPDDLDQLQAEIGAHLKGLTPHFENEHRMCHKDGTYRWMLSRGLAVRGEDGRAYRMAGSQTDVTERKLAEEQLLYDAFHDALTGLPNRALFIDRLDRAISRSRRNESDLFAVLFLDLDRFKIINDSLGHSMGDRLLIRIAERLERSLRPSDTVARVGGDEFVVLLEDIADVRHSMRVAERIQNELKSPFNLGPHEVFTTASIGIALSATGYDQPEEVVRDADTAMYKAKAMGGACHAVFDTEMHALAMARLTLETDLRRAVEREEFRIHYQPIVCLTSGRIRGFEALVRWRHPRRGLLSPAEFLGVAEETGLIVPLGRFVLREACHQARAWQRAAHQGDAAPPLTMSVNLSNKEFLQPDLVGLIRDTLGESELPPESLRLEITENVILHNAESAVDLISELKTCNVQLDVDDFGTGYSSFSYLQDFPIDVLKIDRSFIAAINQRRGRPEIIGALVTLAHKLEMEIIAEGVENAEQLAVLRRLECGFGQGNFFAPPLPPEEAEELLRRNPTW